MGVLADIKTLITSESNIYRNDMPDTPDTPDNVCVLYNTGGFNSGHSLSSSNASYDEPTFQVRIRDSSHDSGITRCEAIIKALDGLCRINHTNLLSDAIAGCESTSGWFTYQSSISADPSNALSGTNCMKVTITAPMAFSGDIYIKGLSTGLIAQGKYYLVSAYIKNGNANSGVKLRVSCKADRGNIDTDLITGTSYTRVGVVVQPSDFDTADEIHIGIHAVGLSFQYAFVDQLMLQEITSDGYALGASALLDIYPWGLGSIPNTSSLTINSNQYITIFKMGDINHIGKDARGRSEFTLNFRTKVRRN